MVYCVVLSSVDSSSTQECGVYECDAEETQLNVDLLRCCCRESAKIKPRSIIHLSMQCQSDAVSLLRHVHTGTRTHAHTTPNRSHPPSDNSARESIGMRRRSAVRFDPSHCREYQIALGGLRCLRGGRKGSGVLFFPAATPTAAAASGGRRLVDHSSCAMRNGTKLIGACACVRACAPACLSRSRCVRSVPTDVSV
jgi:hypothetical protein